MSNFRLRTFSPRPDAGAGSEAGSKAPAITARDLANAREEAYRQGFLVAEADVTAAFLDDRTRLTSDLVEALSDARLSHEAARRHVLASLAPTVAAFCKAVAPALAEAGFAAEIAARVDRALAAAPEARPRLRCAPEVAPTLEALCLARGLGVAVEPAPELLPREAELHWDEGFDRIDMDACVAEVRACLASHLGSAGTGVGSGGEDRG